MKNRNSLIFWLSGLLILFALLYYFIFQHSGYIFYFDSSGSFNYNRPFDQYLFTYTPYDGIEVGIKNRLPIISIIAGAYYLLKPLLDLGAQDVIKIAFGFLFLGAYTAFYIVFPRFYALLRRESVNNEFFSSFKGQLVRVAFSLLYLMVPFFVFRLTMMHMFFFTTFYPLITYVFLQLCEQNRFSWRTILTLVILCFFGFSYTNILHYYLITFLGFSIAAFFSKKDTEKQGLLLKKLFITGVLVVATNIYWIVPYFQKGAPEPGYVVTTTMVEALGNKSSLQNVLLDTSEWFVGQGEKAVVFLDQNKLVAAVQVLGAINVYLLAIFGFKASRRKSYAAAIAFFIFGAFFITVKESPLYQYLYDTIVYYDFGWLIREPNRQRFFVAFWTFLLFGVGVVSLLKQSEKSEEQKEGYIQLSLWVAFVTYLFYVIPWAFTSVTYLKPMEVNADLVKVNEVLDADKEYSYVNTLPSLELYRASWLDKKFDIADIWNYRMNYYSLKRPPAQLNTVVPVSRTSESLITEMLFWKATPEQAAKVLAYLGVKYSLRDNTAVPIFISTGDDAKYYIDPIKKAFEDKEFWTKESGINTYTLGKNKYFDPHDSISMTSNKLVTAEPLSILTELNIDSLSTQKLKFRFADNEDVSLEQQILVYEDNEDYFLDYLNPEDTQKYMLYPFDYTKKYGIPVDWGRASAKDKGGAEFTSVLRYHAVRAYQFVVEDKIAYSNESPMKDGIKPNISFTTELPCVDRCSVYAKILFSEAGGVLDLAVGNVQQLITTRSQTKEGFYWVKLGNDISFSKDKAEIVLKNDGGFNAVSSILILPDVLVNTTRDKVSQHVTYKISRDQKSLFTLPAQGTYCRLDDSTYNDSLIPYVTVSGLCDSPMNMSLKQFQSEFLYINKQSQRMEFTDSVKVNGEFQGEIWFFSKVDLSLWILFFLTFVVIVIFAELVLLKHVR